MSRIKNITLSNFKFFGEAQTIDFSGKHLLLYGENGSGKSSLFWGLYTLLESATKTSAEITKYFQHRDISDESLVNIYAEPQINTSNHQTHFNSFIEVVDSSDNTKRISLFDTDICGDTNLIESHKATDFINYQSIFKFQDFKNSQSPDLYDIFNYAVLPYVDFEAYEDSDHNTITNALQMWKIYKQGPKKVFENGEEKKLEEDNILYLDYKKITELFSEGLSDLIAYINRRAPQIIKELGYDLVFQLDLTPATSSYIIPTPGFFLLEDGGMLLTEDGGFFMTETKIEDDKNFQIDLVITAYNGKSIKISKPQTFLNEAKISALALAIKLSVLERRITTDVAPNAIQALILDDVMISLDMNNRDMLINYILKHYIDKYQIILMTHDKGLYNFIDYKIGQLSNKQLWEYKELYVGIDDAIKQESPMLVDGTCSAFDKAQLFFKANDFSTSSVYLRQSLEKLIAEALPDEIKRRADGKFMSLETLWEKLNNRHTIPQSIQDLFNQSKLMVLNPSAHYQRLSQPIYRRELLAAFDLVKQLTALNLTVDTLLIEKNKRLKFTHPTEPYTFEFELRHDMTLDKTPDPKCNIIAWTYEGTLFKKVDTGIVDSSYSRSTPRFSRLKENLFNLPGLNINERSFLDNTTIEQGTLREALNL